MQNQEKTNTIMNTIETTRPPHLDPKQVASLLADMSGFFVILGGLYIYIERERDAREPKRGGRREGEEGRTECSKYWFLKRLVLRCRKGGRAPNIFRRALNNSCQLHLLDPSPIPWQVFESVFLKYVSV